MRIAATSRNHWNLASTSPSGLREWRVGLSSGGWVDVAHIGEGDPLVLVAGLSGGWELLEPLARRLATRHSVYMTSLRGDRLEFPSAAPPRTVGDFASDLIEVVEELRLERPAVMGVSFGGAVALELAIRRPELPASLVLYGVEAKFRQRMGARIARNVLERFALPQDSPFLNQFFHLLFGCQPEPGPLLDFVVRKCWATNQAELSRRFRALEDFDVAERLWRVEAPTMILAGSKDVIVPPAHQKALAKEIFAAKYAIIPNAGHIGFLTHPRETAQLARTVLRAVSC